MKRMMTLLLAAVLTAALWAGTPLPVQAANEFTPDIVYEQTSFIDTTDWLMVVGQDHVLWVYPSPSSADQASLTGSEQALMTDVETSNMTHPG